MEDAVKPALTFDKSFALIDAEGRLIAWDAGFEQEFFTVRSLIRAGANYRDILWAAHESPGGQMVVAENADSNDHRAFSNRRIAAFGVPRSAEYRMPDGRLIAYEERVTVSGGIWRIARDITVERRAEQELAQLKADAAAAQSASAYVEIWRDPQGNFVPRPIGADYARLLELPPEAIGADAMTVVSRMKLSAEGLSAISRLYARHAETREAFSFEFPIQDGKDRLRWLRQSVIPRREANGTVIFAGVARDITREKEAEDQLQLLRSVVERSADAILVLETDPTPERYTKSIYVNPRFEEIFGLSADSVIGKSLEATIHNEKDRLFRDNAFAALERGDGASVEYQTLGADGSPMWVETRFYVIQRFEDGSYRWVGISRDITAKKAAAAEVELLRSLIVRSSDAVIVFETDGTPERDTAIVYVNPTFMELFPGSTSMQAAEGIGENKINSSAYNQALLAVDRGDGAPFEIQAQRKNGEVIWVEQRAELLKMHDDGSFQWVVISRDITGKKAAVAEVELLRSLTVHSSDAIMVFQTDATPERKTKILYANPTFLSLFARSTEQIPPGISVEMRLGGSEINAIAYETARQAIERGDRTSIETQAELESGEIVWVEQRAEYVQTLADGSFQWVIISRDITERRRTFEQIVQAKLEAEAANKAKADFLANMSHELRTPLNVIIGFSELIEHGIAAGGPSEEYADYIKDIVDSGRHLLGLINSILDLSKIEAGMAKLDLGLLDLNELVNSSVTLVSGLAKEAGIKLVLTERTENTDFTGDHLKLRQVLLNILSNAIKFTLSGGTVEITTNATPTTVEITVADTGCGISSDDLPRIGRPFVQTDSSLARTHAGIGLGLAISKQLCELHRGTLEIDSVEGQGTTVRITLPRRFD